MNQSKKKPLLTAADLLRQEYGAMSRIARKLGVHPSLVSRVARNEKVSGRVASEIARYLALHRRGLVLPHWPGQQGALRGPRA